MPNKPGLFIERQHIVAAGNCGWTIAFDFKRRVAMPGFYMQLCTVSVTRCAADWICQVCINGEFIGAATSKHLEHFVYAWIARR